MGDFSIQLGYPIGDIGFCNTFVNSNKIRSDISIGRMRHNITCEFVPEDFFFRGEKTCVFHQNGIIVCRRVMLSFPFVLVQNIHFLLPAETLSPCFGAQRYV